MMYIKSVQLIFVLFSVILLSGASGSGVPDFGKRQSLAGESEFLPVDEAFQLTATRENNAIELRWRVSSGYYLYRHRLSFDSPDADLGEPDMAAGIPKHDEYFGDVEVYYDELVVTLPLNAAGEGPVEVVVGYQGCADAGLCYPPQKTTIFPEKL